MIFIKGVLGVRMKEGFIVKWLSPEGKLEEIELNADGKEDLLERLKEHIPMKSDIMAVFKANSGAYNTLKKHFKGSV